MKRGLVLAVFLASVAWGASAHAGHYRKYFPLKKGNAWRYSADGASSSISVFATSGSAYRLFPFPHVAYGLWVKWAGETLFAWDNNSSAWRGLFRFGAPAGTPYAPNLPHASLAGVSVKVANKDLKVTNNQVGKTFKKCIQFAFAPPPNTTGSPGFKEFVFAPSVGPVRYGSSNPSGGSSTKNVRFYRLGGKPTGLVDFTTLASGTWSGLPVPPPGPGIVDVINSQAQWKAFWKKLAPTSPLPSVDFSKQTVVAVLAYKVWGLHSVTVNAIHVDGNKVKAYAVLDVQSDVSPLTQPYRVVVIKEKVPGVVFGTWVYGDAPADE